MNKEQIKKILLEEKNKLFNKKYNKLFNKKYNVKSEKGSCFLSLAFSEENGDLVLQFTENENNILFERFELDKAFFALSLYNTLKKKL
jgi:hypothetical protein